MIIAHPDDEVIFGFHDLIHNDVTVICMTNGDNNIRKGEFYQSMKLSGAKGHILNYPDSSNDTWTQFAVEDFYNKDFKHLITQSTGINIYELVVSHGPNGEYGNKQHIRTHAIARHFANEIGLPFKTFQERYRPSDYATHLEKYNMLVNNYVSQKKAISSLIHFFQKDTKATKNGKIVAGQVPNLSLLTKKLK